MPMASSAATAKWIWSSTTRAPKFLPMPSAARIATALRVIRQQLRPDRNVGVVRVLGERQRELELAARFRLDPLAAYDRGRRDVRYRPFGEIDRPDRRDDLERAHRLGDVGLALRVVAALQRGEAGIEQRHASADLLRPLPSGGLLVAVAQCLRRQPCQGRLVWPGRVPVAGG